MGCNCGGKKIPQTYNAKTSNATNGQNQAILKQIEQQQQQSKIQQIVQQSVNPTKTLIKTYR